MTNIIEQINPEFTAFISNLLTRSMIEVDDDDSSNTEDPYIEFVFTDEYKGFLLVNEFTNRSINIDSLMLSPSCLGLNNYDIEDSINFENFEDLSNRLTIYKIEPVIF